MNQVFRKRTDGNYLFWCPGCKRAHVAYVEPGTYETLWEWNKDTVKPTLKPSILIQRRRWEPEVTPENFDQFKAAPWPQKQVDFVCHSFVEEGQIRFLADCTHALAGQTVPLEPYRFPGETPHA